MPDYSKGKIYMIYSRLTNKKFIGSTTSFTIATRLADQASKYRKYRDNDDGTYSTAYEILKDGPENYYIELIELYPCNSKDELARRTGEIIRATECVNKTVPGRTFEECRKECPEKLKESYQKYYNNNFTKISARRKISSKIYREENADAIAANASAYNKANRTHINEVQNRWRANKREAVRLYNDTIKELYAIEID